MIMFEHLKKHGYQIFEKVLNEDEISEYKREFFKWYNNAPSVKILHPIIGVRGIFKHQEVAQQRHAWLIRTNPKVRKIFEQLWETNDLVVSQDGCCYIDKTCKKKDNIWTHTDQAPATKGSVCYQGFVSLTDNQERTFRVYDKSHLLHESYFQDNDSKKNWNKIDEDTLKLMKKEKRVLKVPAGSLVLWDSRSFHQNQYGKPDSEERLVQYVCYLPRNNDKNTQAMNKKRRKYFEEKRTTSHWPYPIYVNGKQPRTYGRDDLRIDYESLPSPQLDDIMGEIQKLI